MANRYATLRVLGLILFVFPAYAGERGESWKQTRAVSAPEANQAAAADERYLYAIGNTQIAKYDCKTGERIALSIGPAKHLNSGFVWEGKLYCAHSNYPKTPELSQIMVLDPESMKLTTFKDFGDYGGSLTWVIRKDTSWWCNFARYGANNKETFLVQLDKDWKEKGRWTYPAEVTNKLGSYSVSGGVWRGEHLLVTGHDDLVLFRLRLPKDGKVLEYVQTERAPFTGQGIALDPVTGGLVGIHRGKRKILFAESDQETK